MRGTVRERLLAKIDKQPGDGCWLWTAATCKSTGYGRFCLRRGVIVPAHRAVYEALVGPIPNGLTLDHLCRVRACVRPSHLEPVTHRENVRRGVGAPAANAVKTHCSRAHDLLDEANVYIGKGDGKRYCRACNRIRNRELIARRLAVKGYVNADDDAST